MPTKKPAAPTPPARRARRPRPAATALLVGLLGALVLAAPALAVVPNTPDSTYVVNGNASSVVRAGNTVYVGGNFSQIGPRTGSLVSLDPTTGAYDPHTAQIDGGTVIAVASDGAGGEYVGGVFNEVGGYALTNAAHILANGSVDPNWAPNPDGSVSAIAVSGNTVYLGGGFSHITNSTGTGTVARSNAGAVDAVLGRDTGWNPSPNATVQALAVSGSHVYLGGYFTSVTNSSGTGTDVRDQAAEVDATTGDDTAWNPNPNGAVLAIAVNPSATTVYLGGSFGTVENATGTGTDLRTNAAAVDANTGWDEPWNPSPDGSVDAIALSGSGTTVYIGGSFSNVENATGTGTTTQLNAAAVDATTGYDDVAWSPVPNNTVRTIAVSGNAVYLGGQFTNVESASGDRGVTRNYLAAVDTTRGRDTGWNPNMGSTVFSVALGSSGVIAGGIFDSVNGQARSNAAAVDAATGQPTGWNPSPDGAVQALAINDKTVYLGGDFTHVASANGPQPRAHAAAVDTTNGYDTGWNPSPNGTVDTLTYAPYPNTSEDVVYLGGSFTSIEGGSLTRGDAAAVDATSGAAVGWDPGANGTIRTLLLSGERVYLGGDFTSVNYGAATRNNAAAVDADAGGAFAWNPNAGGEVVTLAIDGSTVYLGGYFTTINGGTPRNYAAAVDATTGVATGWNPNPSNAVGALAVEDGSVYMAGVFRSIENSTGTGTVSRVDLASVDTTNGYDTGWNPTIGFYLAPAVITVNPNSAGVIGQLTFSADGTLYLAGLVRGGFASFSVPVANTAAPAISGTAAAGQTLTCSTGSWTGTTPQTYTYQWQRGGTVVSGATGTTYAVTSADAGASLTCTVTATNIRSSATATSPPVTVARPGAPVAPLKLLPNSNFELLHAPYVNTTTGAVGLYDMFHNPGTLSWRVYFHNGDAGVVTAIAAAARKHCGPYQVRLKGHCHPEFVLFGQGQTTVAGPGALHFSISPLAAARRALRIARHRHLGGLPVAVVVTFQSAEGGPSVTHTVRVVVPLHWH